MITPEQCLEKQASAYDALRSALERKLTVDQVLIRAKIDLKDAENSVLANTDAKSLGSNQSERDARLAVLTAHNVKDVTNAENVQRLVNAEVEIARLAVEQYREASKLLALVVPFAGKGFPV
jgi:hypothetical protein